MLAVSFTDFIKYKKKFKIRRPGAFKQFITRSVHIELPLQSQK
jgi:hypothetical protein